LRVASSPGTAGRDGAVREPTRALFVPPVANLKSARTLALDDDVAVLRAQFDLANRRPGAGQMTSDHRVWPD